MRIGFFDSGIGGVTVLKEALKILPDEEYIYYADTSNVPYGTKNKNEVRKYIFNAVDFLTSKGIDALVIACNTATSIAVKDLREKYDFPIIGMEPAVKPAIQKCGDKRVLVTATPLTIKEEKYRNLISRVDAEHIVDSLALPELVEYAERFIFEEDIIIPYLKNKLSHFNLNEYGTLVLGCTHFLFYKNYFKKIIPPEIDIVDGNRGTVRHLKNILQQNGLTGQKNKQGSVLFYSSGKGEQNILDKYLRVLAP
jgi:glutamate racemase